ncbi:phosphotransferase [Arthrobacter monumenti]
MVEPEQALTGGNATDEVVRIGDTVRKPWHSTTPAVHQFLRVMREQGVDAPQPLGQDEHGRQVMEFVPGTLAIEMLPLNPQDLRRVGAMVRRIHDISTGFPVPDMDEWDVLIPAADADLMCHNDLAPWNLIVGERWVFIDWDAAGPSTRLWDLAYSAQSFALLVQGEPVDAAAARLRAFIDGYGAGDELRAALPAAMSERTAAMHHMLQSANENDVQPWGRMYVEGHGTHWREAAEYVQHHQSAWAAALTAP